MPASAVVRAAGGPEDLSGYRVIVGGPMMGRLADDVNEPVTKTTGGLIVLREDHPLVIKKSGRMQTDLKLARSVCCQCSFCTQLCPRNALGLKVEPHKVMRALALGAPDMGDANGIFSCCDCGICTFYACNFGLAPSRMMQRAKQELLKSGVRPQKKTARDASGNKDDIRVPVKRLISRLGIEKYDRDLPLNDELLETGKVRIPLKMHVGSPAKPVVSEGERVEKGLRIAAVSEGIGADVHASISGRVHITESCIEIEG
jgi:Na+-translocating ferredoxin:NAD+ oxidoreductase RnfC subunit